MRLGVSVFSVPDYFFNSALLQGHTVVIRNVETGLYVYQVINSLKEKGTRQKQFHLGYEHQAKF